MCQTQKRLFSTFIWSTLTCKSFRHVVSEVFGLLPFFRSFLQLRRRRYSFLGSAGADQSSSGRSNACVTAALASLSSVSNYFKLFLLVWTGVSSQSSFVVGAEVLVLDRGPEATLTGFF